MLLAMAAPVIAQDDPRIDHSIRYAVDGLISIDRQLGHACTTGAVKRQTVRGYGEMFKTETVRIAPHIITVDEETDWITASDAIRNLSVITTIDLCARPMSTAAHDYSEGDYDIKEGDIISPYHPLVVSGDLLVRPMTSQLWAASVTANPGQEGTYHSDFIAAYGPGPYEEVFGQMDEFGIVTFYEDDYRWWFDPIKVDGIDSGDHYVGNYFEIDQYAYTSGGEMTRFISMSSPFYNTLLLDDMAIVGMAEVRESFEMRNLEPGPLAITFAWYDLF